MLLWASLFGCATTPTQAASKAILSTKAFSTSMMHSFEAWDLGHQRELEHNTAALLAYRNEQQRVVIAFHTLDALLAVGDSLLPMVESGLKDNTDLTAFLRQLHQTVIAVQTELAGLGFINPKTPGL